MKDSQLLIEHLTPKQAGIIEESANGGKDLYLNGIFMQSECENGNGRNYPLNEIANAVKFVQEKIEEGQPIAGELNHPDHLQIDLERVSHVITEIRMDGNNAVGKAKLLNTPMGNIAKGLVEGGVRLGVSSRGTGNVNEGVVSDFNFVTIDIVATPSAPNAYPQAIREHLEMVGNSGEIMKLSEAVVHDPAAQKHFMKEMKSFMDLLINGK